MSTTGRLNIRPHRVHAPTWYTTGTTSTRSMPLPPTRYAARLPKTSVPWPTTTVLRYSCANQVHRATGILSSTLPATSTRPTASPVQVPLVSMPCSAPRYCAIRSMPPLWLPPIANSRVSPTCCSLSSRCRCSTSTCTAFPCCLRAISTVYQRKLPTLITSAGALSTRRHLASTAPNTSAT